MTTRQREVLFGIGAGIVVSLFWIAIFGIF